MDVTPWCFNCGWDGIGLDGIGYLWVEWGAEHKYGANYKYYRIKIQVKFFICLVVSKAAPPKLCPGFQPCSTLILYIYI